MKKYKCRHCGKRFKLSYMPDICFQLHLKILQYEKPDQKHKLDDKKSIDNEK